MSNEHDAGRKRSIQPPFRGIPTNQIPELVPLHLVLARNDTIAVWLTGVHVYSTCMTFAVEASVTGTDRFLDLYGFGKRQPTHTPQMLIGFETADGIRATNLQGRRTGLSGNGSSGSGLHGKVGYVLSPVPPAGPLEVYFAWPHFGIDETRHTLDGHQYASAIERVVTLWDDIDPSSSQIDIDDRTVPELEIPSGSWFAAAFELQKPPPPDPNAPQRINFAHVRKDM
ncbi:hypothetical protein ABIB34_002417 [Rhodococcus sp. UYP5]